MTVLMREPCPIDLNQISGAVVDAAIQVHSKLGPGLLESAYESCLLYELHQRGMRAENQVLLPIQYGSIRIDAGYRIDMIVEDAVILELKAVEAVLPVHKAQLLSYLRLSNKRLGLLINFNVTLLKQGISRIVNKL